MVPKATFAIKNPIGDKTRHFDGMCGRHTVFILFQFTFKIQAFSSKLLSRFRHFLPRYFQDQTFSSKLLPRSGIFFQVTSKIRHFLPSYFQDQIFSCKILPDQTISCKILQDQTLSSKIFQDTCKNNALSSKILEVKSDRFLQKMYGSSTGECFFPNCRNGPRNPFHE